ncbi:uncharacterized protein BXZ73DRAFT_47246 [Epithele typhae]|uniref:uncharacterized protein n=1 Tax=Epithele typhae TaxID=378194 RepID=UPI0020089FEB|nr:uncharacterized protein BXZ73DRAFT_47246 [Epithele typhae]KAH9931683.1 hypothetical protein BXZ73DRAFT_47246 [Epithele typhae]
MSVDYSQPVTDLLREGTREAHERAEKSTGAQYLVTGGLSKQEYIRFLMMLWHVYDAFENALEQHATHPVLAPTHNPGLFARSENLAADISTLLEVPETSWKAHPVHLALEKKTPAALKRYVGRLRELAASSDPSRLLSHAYVRYLGDLSGGQFIKRRIGKAYGLEDGAGLSFYAFRPLEGGLVTGGAGLGEMKRIKEWFRDGMNAGVGDDAKLKAAVLDEAVRAFEFNTALFDVLRVPEQLFVSSTTVQVPSPLSSPTNAPLSPAQPVYEDMGNSPLLEAIKKSGESKTVFEAEEPPKQEWVVQVTSVIAIIAAFGIAHFVLVVGGFTGSRGYDKLYTLQQWLDGVLGTTV